MEKENSTTPPPASNERRSQRTLLTAFNRLFSTLAAQQYGLDCLAHSLQPSLGSYWPG